jgi:hypothetical protein
MLLINNGITIENHGVLHSRPLYIHSLKWASICSGVVTIYKYNKRDLTLVQYIHIINLLPGYQAGTAPSNMEPLTLQWLTCLMSPHSLGPQSKSNIVRVKYSPSPHDTYCSYRLNMKILAYNHALIARLALQLNPTGLLATFQYSILLPSHSWIRAAPHQHNHDVGPPNIRINLNFTCYYVIH